MSNLNSLKKSDLIALVEQLERNAEDDRRRIGVMMYEANQLQHRVNELESEVEDLSCQLADINEDALNDKIDDLESVVEAQAERIKLLSRKVAAQPKTTPRSPKPAPKPQAPVSDIESVSPVIQITDADREVYRKFNALPREQRLAIIAWARPTFGNVGIDNIQAVRAAWHEFQAQSVA